MAGEHFAAQSCRAPRATAILEYRIGRTRPRFSLSVAARSDAIRQVVSPDYIAWKAFQEDIANLTYPLSPINITLEST